jgi:hypothetical protein
MDDVARVMTYFERRGIYLPIFISMWFLIRLWRERELFGKSGTIFCLWFIGATILQLFAPGIGLSIVGVLSQVALAIVLILKQQLNEIV